MTDIPFGTIVLTNFPFTDLSATKRRPAPVISKDNFRRSDIIMAYITSVSREEPDAVPIWPDPENGLKVPSTVRFDKIATIDKAIVAGKIGAVAPEWLMQNRETFFGVFGFEPVKA